MAPHCHGEVPERSLHPQEGSAMVNGESDLGCLDQLTPKVYGGQGTSRRPQNKKFLVDSSKDR